MLRAYRVLVCGTSNKLLSDTLGCDLPHFYSLHRAPGKLTMICKLTFIEQNQRIGGLLVAFLFLSPIKR